MQFGNTSLTYFIKHKKYQDQILEEIDDAEKVISKSGDINLKSFDLHDELNNQVWDEKQNLKPGIREQLLQIAHDFYDTLDIAEITEKGDPDEKPDKTFDKYIKDVFFVGSLASFNYSSYADVDLHLLMDEEKVVGKNKLALNILKKYFTECKNDWNLKHSDLTVEGYDCELYVQDIKEKNASNGVYSLFNDEWVKRPEKLDTKNFDKAWVEKKALDYIEKIDNFEEIIQSKSDLELIEKAANELKKIKDKIVQGRRDSLAAGQGEMNKYNILFKILRRSGHIGKINDLRVKAYDMLNSFNNKKDLTKKGNNMKKDESILVKEDDEMTSIEEFEKMYGPDASKALKTYLNKRINKSAEQVLMSDDEFEKFTSWAYRHLGIDVYSRFSKYDRGTFYDRTSNLLKNPEQRNQDDELRVGDVYSYDDSDANDYDSAVDTWNEPSKFDDDSVEESYIVKEDENCIKENHHICMKNESIIVVEDGVDANTGEKVEMKGPGKEKIIICKAEDDENVTFIMLTNEPRDAANKFLDSYNGTAREEYKKEHDGSDEGFEPLKWEKDKEYNYWCTAMPKKRDDVQKDLESNFGSSFEIEIYDPKSEELKDADGKTIGGGEEKTETESQEPVTNQQQQNNPSTNNNQQNTNTTGGNQTQTNSTNTSNQNQTNNQSTQTEQNTNQQNNQTNNQQTDQTSNGTQTTDQQPKESESTAKITGGTWDEFLKNIEDQTTYSVNSAFKRHPNQWIELIGKDGQIYDGEVTKYEDGEYELLYTNISPVPNMESKKPAPINESYADDTIDNIKSILHKYFEVDPETEEPNEEYDENFTAQDAIDEIVDILY